MIENWSKIIDNFEVINFWSNKSFRTLFFNPPAHLNPFGERTVKTVPIIGRSLTHTSRYSHFVQ